MAWNYDQSKKRILDHLAQLEEIEVKKLVREADLEGLLSEKCCRTIYGAHVYVDISNFTRLASALPDDDPDAYRTLIQAVHLYQRELSRIVEHTNHFNGFRVHFQGSRLHALFYRPIDNSEVLAARALLLPLVVKSYVRSVFNPAFPSLDDLSVASGADLGDVIGTRNGQHSDRELLFLGSPANHAAKIISSSGRLRLTQAVFEALPESLQGLCSAVDSEADSEIYQLTFVSDSDLDELLDEWGIGWSRDDSRSRLQADLDAYPLGDIKVSSATTKIDLDSLGVRNNKRVQAATIYGDVSGFTAYIDAAETEEDQQTALRVFHAIRREMSRVIRVDLDGLRIQFQGDRIQGLFHLPKDDCEGIIAAAIDAAGGLQSSMRVIHECLPESGELTLAVGVDIGGTLVSRLGARGHRDRTCIGAAVENAARCEERCKGDQTGISKTAYDALAADRRDFFKWDASAQCYVATDLDASTLESARKAASYSSVRHVSSGAGGVQITENPRPDSRPVAVTRSWSKQ